VIEARDLVTLFCPAMLTGSDAALATRCSVDEIELDSLKAGMMTDTSGLKTSGSVSKGTRPSGKAPFRCFHRKIMYVIP